MNYQDCSGRTLAFLGDAVWSLVVRKHLLMDGEGKGSTLQKKSIQLVSAKAQASFYDRLHEKNFFTGEEEEVYRRGRNDNSSTVPNHTSMSVYRRSTGFEAILGMLEMGQKWERIEEIWEQCAALKEEESCQN